MKARALFTLMALLCIMSFSTAVNADGQQSPTGDSQRIKRIREYLTMLEKRPMSDMLESCIEYRQRWQYISLGVTQRREEALIVLRKWLQAGTDQQKMLAIGALREMRDDKAIPDLLSLTRSGNPEEIGRAMIALREMKAAASAPRFREILSEVDSPKGEKILACVGLGVVGSRDDIPVLLPFMGEKDSDVRLYAAIAVTMLGGTEGRSLILEELKRGNPTAINYGAKYLDDVESADLLEKLAESKRGWSAEAGAALERRRLRNIRALPEKVSELKKQALSSITIGSDSGRWNLWVI